jgi:predicted metalloprotease
MNIKDSNSYSNSKSFEPRWGRISFVVLIMTISVASLGVALGQVFGGSSLANASENKSGNSQQTSVNVDSGYEKNDIIMHIVQPDETIWNIASKYASKGQEQDLANILYEAYGSTIAPGDAVEFKL